MENLPGKPFQVFFSNLNNRLNIFQNFTAFTSTSSDLTFIVYALDDMEYMLKDMGQNLM